MARSYEIHVILPPRNYNAVGDNLFEHLIGRSPGIADEEKYKKYAVMAPYLPKSGELLFEVRSEALRSQPGEICFPGGRMERGEAPEQAALRETAEELKLNRQAIEVIAPLDILITPFNTMIYPYLGVLEDYRGTFSRDEVKEVFTVPFAFFQQQSPDVYHNRVTTYPDDPAFPHNLLGTEQYPWGKGKYPVLFYRYGNRVIWGLTAKMINNLVRLAASGSEGKAT